MFGGAGEHRGYEQGLGFESSSHHGLTVAVGKSPPL